MGNILPGNKLPGYFRSSLRDSIAGPLSTVFLIFFYGTSIISVSLRDTGFQDGEIKGKIKGEVKGRRILLEHLLTRRFGTLPDWGREQLANATVEQLDRWGDRVLDAETIQAVLTE